MFGNKSGPSRDFKFGAKPPQQFEREVSDQMYFMHQYHKARIENVHRHRDSYVQLRRDHCPDVLAGEEEVDRLAAQLKAKRAEIKAGNAKARKRSATRLIQGQIRIILASLRQAKIPLKAAKLRAKNNRRLNRAVKSLQEFTDSESKRLQAASGLYWGNYLLINRAVDAALKSKQLPKFPRWTGDGIIAVQIQNGMTLERAMSGLDKRIRIDPPNPESVRPTWHTLWIRIGSDDQRRPIWTKTHFKMHEALPEDGKIKWVKLCRERVGSINHWRVIFTVERAAGFFKTDQAKTGQVGIDLNWRKMPDGSLRVASWVGSDGKSGHLSLDPSYINAIGKVRSLQGIRDGKINVWKEKLAAWIKDRVARELPVHPWMIEAAETMHLWRGAKRLLTFSRQWGSAHLIGDDAIRQELAEWTVKELHLFNWERHLERRIAARRVYFYQQFACQIRRAYRTIHLEAMNLQDSFHKLPKPEVNETDDAVRVWHRLAAVGELRTKLLAHIGAARWFEAKDTTRRCHDCGHVNDTVDFTKSIEITCVGCGRTWDQDVNAARNLLGEVTAEVDPKTARSRKRKVLEMPEPPATTAGDQAGSSNVA